MDNLCTIKIKVESQNLDNGCIKEQLPYLNHNQDAKPKSGNSSILQKPMSGLKRHGYSLCLKIKTESQNLEYWCIKDHCPYGNNDQDVKPQSETSSILQSPKSGLKGHWCSLPFKIKNKTPNPSQEPPASSESSSQDLEYMDVLCTFKIKREG